MNPYTSTVDLLKHFKDNNDGDCYFSSYKTQFMENVVAKSKDP